MLLVAGPGTRVQGPGPRALVRTQGPRPMALVPILDSGLGSALDQAARWCQGMVVSDMREALLNLDDFAVFQGSSSSRST